MKRFQSKKLIVRIGQEVYQLDNIDELIEKVLGEQYKDLTDKEKLLKRYESMLPFSVQSRIPIVYSSKGVVREDKSFDTVAEYNINNSLLIDDEYTYFLSLCRLNQLQILEQKDADIFTAGMDKRKTNGNYIVVNNFIDELFNNYVNGEVAEERATDEK